MVYTFVSIPCFFMQKNWFRLIKQDNLSLSDVLLNEGSEKYKYNPYPINCEGVLFLEFTLELEHFQTIDLSLSEQSHTNGYIFVF